MQGKMNRRRFLKASAAAGAGYWLLGGVTESRAARQADPMNRLNVAVIGCGGRGAGNVGGVAGENIVALCDVDDQRAAGSFNKYPKVPKYKDFRVMLDKQKDIEAVVVSTPDHTHAIASILAMRMGKHCYTEKPLTHSVHEARLMRQVAAKHRVATQMGNQGTSMNGLREAVEVIRAGTIGDVREVHVWTNRPGTFWRQGFAKPLPRQDVPKTLDWDLWLGPAPQRDYNGGYVPFAWRGWWDFGTGALGDMGCHTMNMPYMALQLGAPTTVLAETDQPVNDQSPPNGCRVTYEFAARGQLPACRMYWYEVRRPALDLFEGLKNISSSGCLLIGSKGKMYSSSDYGGSYQLLPRDNFKGHKPPQPTLPRSPGHHAEWIRACKGGPAALGNFDYSGPLTECVLLGNVAMRAGKRITWNAEKLQVVGMSEADRFIRREYRKGWSLE